MEITGLSLIMSVPRHNQTTMCFQRNYPLTRIIPNFLLSGITAVAITAGNAYTCVVSLNGTVLCWGYNGYGELGDGSTTMRKTPVMVSGVDESDSWKSFFFGDVCFRAAERRGS